MAHKKSIQSLGGEARKKALSPELRSTIASAAAAARWSKIPDNPDNPKIPRATHEAEDLVLGGVTIPCAVLEDGTRVLSERGVTKALGGKRGGSHWLRLKEGGAKLPVYLSADNLKPFISNSLGVALSRPILYKSISGGMAYGLPATLLADVCEVFLKARDTKGGLHPKQKPLADMADLLIRSLAKVGIIALIDEATGFQYDRPKKELEEQLKKFLSENLRRWVRTFPDEYLKNLCRLRGVELGPDKKLPQYFGHLTNNLVYRRLAPGLLKKLKERKRERGHASDKLHSWLSEDIGLRGVLVHLGMVIGYMKIHTDYKEFEKQLNDVAPIYSETLGLFDDPKDWDEPE
jgi:hypothetical protein